MSIPPLVCSTPPPPDQCEDDKDLEDFPAHYNLSQDELDDSPNYDYTDINYGNLNTSNDYHTDVNELPGYLITDESKHSSPSAVTSEVIMNSEITEHNPSPKLITECEKECGSYNSKGISRVDEDNNIEDLDLKLGPLETTEKINSINTLTSEIYDEGFDNYLTAAATTDDKEGNVSADNNASPQNNVSWKESCDGSSKENVNESDLSSKDDSFCDYVTESSDDKSSNNFLNDEEIVIVDSVGNVEAERPPNDDKQSYDVDTDLKDPVDLPDNENEDAVDNPPNLEIDDDFDDFHDFDTFRSMSANVLTNTSLFSKSDNLNSQIETVSEVLTVKRADDFSDFDAFQDTQSDEVNSSSTQEDIVENFDKTMDVQVKSAPSTEQQDEDDDFGDFDDYRSTTIEISNRAEEEAISNQTQDTDSSSLSNLSSIVMNEKHNEKQLLENIEHIINNMFIKDMEENPEVVFKGNLEGTLSETWGHLNEVEVRQPFAQIWNNCTSQKTLLKSLGIDTRNILFGPKWNLNMPRFAANLGPTPLQPLKPATAPSSSAATTPSSNRQTVSSGQQDKNGVTASIAADWTNLTASENQEFSYAESLLLDLEHLMATLDQMTNSSQSSLKISDLFGGATQGKAEVGVIAKPSPNNNDERNANTANENVPAKTHPNSLNLYRQINLPDTHIFTPTDSEEPHSQTIHYGRSSSDVNTDTDQKNGEETSELKVQSEVEDSVPEVNSSEVVAEANFDDFQDFQGPGAEVKVEVTTKLTGFIKADNSEESSKIKIPKSNNVPSASGAPYQGHRILEPVKIEALKPQLNWPDPGEVMQTFDDFADFVAHSGWTKVEATADTIQPVESTTTTVTTVAPNVNGNIIESRKPVETNFENRIKSPNNFSSSPITTDVQKGDDFDDFDHFQSATEVSYPVKANSPRSAYIAPHQMPQQNSVPQPFVHNHIVTASPATNFHMYTPVSSPMKTPIKPQVLLPNPSQQILQPLSLESYSQINWPDPGLTLQDLSKFNPVHSLQSFQSYSSPKSIGSKIPTLPSNHSASSADDDGWGDFVSTKPHSSPNHVPVKQAAPDDSDDWCDFVSNTGSKQVNGLNTISLNVHTNLATSGQTTTTKIKADSRNAVEIPSLNYITPKLNTVNSRRHDNHFQNL